MFTDYIRDLKNMGIHLLDEKHLIFIHTDAVHRFFILISRANLV